MKHRYCQDCNTLISNYYTKRCKSLSEHQKLHGKCFKIIFELYKLKIVIFKNGNYMINPRFGEQKEIAMCKLEVRK